MLYEACRDYAEIKHLATLLYPKYAEPVTRGDGTPRCEMYVYVGVRRCDTCAEGA